MKELENVSIKGLIYMPQQSSHLLLKEASNSIFRAACNSTMDRIVFSALYL